MLRSLADSGREIIEIDRAAVAQFAGNMLELAASDEALGDVRVLVMSARARQALDARDLGAPERRRSTACSLCRCRPSSGSAGAGYAA